MVSFGSPDTTQVQSHRNSCSRAPALRRMFALLITMVAATEALAASGPPGSFVTARMVDSETLCASYVNRQNTEHYIIRADGQKLAGKAFWSKRMIDPAIARLTSDMQRLRSSGSKSAKKAFKRAKADKAALSAAKRNLRQCALGNPPNADEPLLQFSHITNLVEKSCLSCHAALGWQNTNTFFVDSGRIVPGDLESSPFYTFLTANPEGYQPAYMPKGLSALPALDIWRIARWISDSARSGGDTPLPTPTPGGEEGEGRALYQQYCAACHNPIDSATKLRRSADEIARAIATVPQMQHLGASLTQVQLNKIALALSRATPPVIDGSVAVRSLGDVTEGNPGSPQQMARFEITFTGSSQPFTIGYVTSNGPATGSAIPALAGKDYGFRVGTLEFSGLNGEAKVVEVPVYPNLYEQPDLMFSLDIGGSSRAAVQVATSTALVTIIDDDTAALVQVPRASSVRMAFNFNTDFKDALGLSDAIAQGAPTVVSPGRVGGGALQVSSADSLTVPGARLAGMNAFTFAAWVNWTNPASTSSRIFDFGSSTTNYIYVTGRDANNRCRFEIRGSATFTLQCPTNVTLPGNQWVHLAVTYDPSSGEMKIFTNGQIAASRTGVTVPMSGLTFSQNSLLRSRVSGATNFTGRLDEVYVWSAALSQAEIAELMNLTASGTFTAALRVSLNGQTVLNGSTIDLGDIDIAQGWQESLTVENLDIAGLHFTSIPNVSVVGGQAQEFSLEVQPFAWQQLIAPGNLTAFTVRFAPRLPGVHVATVVVPNSDQHNQNFGFAIRARAVGSAVIPSPTPSPGSPDANLVAGQQLYSTTCAGCHGSLAASQKRNVTSLRLVNALALNGVPSMQGLNLSETQVAQIVLALNSPPPESESGVAHVRSAIKPRGTAQHVAERFRAVFLPDVPVASYTTDDTALWAIISQNILGRNPANGALTSGRAPFFGGHCSRFESLTCPQEMQVSNMRAAANTVRSGLLIRTCESLLANVNNDRALVNALARIGHGTADPLDVSSMRALYRLFQPGAVLPNSIATLLVTFTSGMSGLSNADRWRYAALAICDDVHWEDF